MRFLHTADWHLGRIFHGLHLTEDQALLLDQLVEVAIESEVSAVLLAGDVFDRAVPPPEAVRLLSDTLERLFAANIQLIGVAGNHDSAERLGFCSGVMGGLGVHLKGRIDLARKPVVLMDDDGLYLVFAIPYCEPAVGRQALGDEGLSDHDALMGVLCTDCRQQLALARKKSSKPVRALAVAHAFVTGGLGSESERPLSVGGTGAVNPAHFEGFDYAALGHLHRAQKVGAEHIQYAGSLYPYSFSEAKHEKSVSLVDLSKTGDLSVERVQLNPRRRVRCIEGSLRELLHGGQADPESDDYIMATLTDPGVVRDPMGQLRARYPKLLHVARPDLIPAARSGPSVAERRKLTVADLFASFYEDRREGKLSQEQAETFARVVDSLAAREREA